MYHAFLRSRDGTITTFDFPGATSTSGASINQEGTITGSYFDVAVQVHGFVRQRDGGSAARDDASIGVFGTERRVEETDAAGGGMGHFSKARSGAPRLIRFNFTNAPGLNFRGRCPPLFAMAHY
jgi:hypothetical protein